MAEGEDKDTPGEGGARGAPVSAGPCSLLAWPLGNLASLLTGVPLLPEGTQFRWNMRSNKSICVGCPSLFWVANNNPIFRPPPAKPFGGPLDHVRTCLGSIRSFLLGRSRNPSKVLYCDCVFSILGSFLHPRRRQWGRLPSIW